MKLPKHCLPARTFKRDRRNGIKNAIKALGDARTGCAFTPAFREIVEANRLLTVAKEKCSVRNWGR